MYKSCWEHRHPIIHMYFPKVFAMVRVKIKIFIIKTIHVMVENLGYRQKCEVQKINYNLTNIQKKKRGNMGNILLKGFSSPLLTIHSLIILQVIIYSTRIWLLIGIQYYIKFIYNHLFNSSSNIRFKMYLIFHTINTTVMNNVSLGLKLSMSHIISAG